MREAQLVVLEGHGRGRIYHLGDGMELGRTEVCPVEFVDAGISRRHATIRNEADGYFIEDLGSRNGTYINGERISGVRALAFGDRIGVGSRTTLLFTRRDRLEEQRVQAQRLQALGQLAGGIAHDFNNLLGVVLANVSHVQLQVASAGPEVMEMLKDVEIAARRAVELTHQLLSFARTGQRSDQPTLLEPLIDDLLRLIRRTLPRTISVECTLEPRLGFMGDASQILQVLMNLCINAGDAMPDGGKLQIAARARTVTASEIEVDSVLVTGPYLSITVRDDGVGMAPEICDRIFEPFFTTKPRGQGTGLGLATATAILRDHGGHITVASVAGEGTTFEVLLPLHTTSKATRENLRVDALGPRVRPSEKLVLLADDEALIRSVARRVLQDAGFRTIEAHDGLCAVELFAAHEGEIGLVLLDLDMPGLTGDQAYDQIRSRSRSVPVLISSGYVEHQQEETLLRKGVAKVLHKPYDSHRLVRTVYEVLQRAAEIEQFPHAHDTQVPEESESD